MRSTTRFSKTVKAGAALLFWLVIWYVAALKVGQDLILPGPAAVLKTLAELSSDGDFWYTAFISLLRIFGGFAAGAVIGTVLAALTSCSGVLDTLISPILKGS